jgi:hypothetical protein
VTRVSPGRVLGCTIEIVRRSLVVLGMAAAVLILAFVALFSAGDGGAPSHSGALPTIPTTTTTNPRTTTSTTVVIVRAQGSVTKFTLVVVLVPNVVGMTLAQAAPALSAVGLAYEFTHVPEPSGTSATGTIVAQTPDAGSKVPRGSDIQVTVSGY